MALFNRAGNILRQAAIKNQSPCNFQMIRCWSNFKVAVRGLAPDLDDTSLREAFTEHGDVTEARVIRDPETGRSRGLGFVTFVEYESAHKAIEARDQWDLHGQTVTVRWAPDAGCDFQDDHRLCSSGETSDECDNIGPVKGRSDNDDFEVERGTVSSGADPVEGSDENIDEPAKRA